MDGKQDAFRQQVLLIPGVKSAALSADSPASGNENNSNVTREGDDPSQTVLIGRQAVDYEFFDTYQIEFVAGRAYSRDRETDGNPLAENYVEGQDLVGTMVINEAAVRRLGYLSPEDALGKRVIIGVGRDIDATMEIIGVIQDIQFQSLRQSMRPEMYQLDRRFFNTLSIKFEGAAAPIVTQVENI